MQSPKYSIAAFLVSTGKGAAPTISERKDDGS
jgi:hypothetical protein